MVIFHSYFFNISSFQKETVVADSRSLPVNSKNRPPGPFFCSSGVGIVGGLELPNVPWRNGVMKHIPSAVGHLDLVAKRAVLSEVSRNGQRSHLLKSEVGSKSAYLHK